MAQPISIPRKQQGFTLVEIAIVLVIIGLLLGGILKGQEMIVQARIKNVINDFNGVTAAYAGYQDRYRAIPGDDNGAAGATGRWTDLAAALNGDRNGQIAGKWNSTTANDESRLFWLHLRRAGFVPGTGQDQPNNATAGLLGVQTADAGAVPKPALGSDANGTGGFAGILLCSGNLPDKISIAVDTQMDDGVPLTGGVRAQLIAAGNPNPDVANQAGTTYAETGTNVYVICRAF